MDCEVNLPYCLHPFFSARPRVRKQRDRAIVGTQSETFLAHCLTRHSISQIDDTSGEVRVLRKRMA